MVLQEQTHSAAPKPSLLVLAAGLGSRYGGLKQIDPVGPAGETIIDYSIYDALRAGFGKIVFVIRHDIEDAFRQTIGRKYEKRAPVEYVFQELHKVPRGFAVPPSRQKPWGTGHAILMGADAVREPFAAINADDFYGAASYKILHDQLTSGSSDYSMVGFALRNTLSEHGAVSRGVCSCDSNGCLKTIAEFTKIEKEGSGAKYMDESGATHKLTGDEIVSMNLWGFRPGLFDQLRELFADFLKKRGSDDKAEFFIPSAINSLVNSGKVRLKVLRTPDSWFGVTYRKDQPRVAASIRALVAGGAYPSPLWE
ncbi:MAG TPA: sugar phosphate nucleotidyltransferase [Verrucomicrobiae bacterium]|nr:sugar phosphate nucleotidyltransferase [Verrucomicrobiae bacterium]